jgi:hypothetical protein
LRSRARRARLEARLTDAYKPPPKSPQCGAGSEERGRWLRLWRNATTIDDPAVATCITDQIRVVYEQLQAEERRVLQEGHALGAAEQHCCEYEYDKSVLLQAELGRKKTKPVPSSSVSVPAAPLEVLELRVSEVGDRVVVVNVTARRSCYSPLCSRPCSPQGRPANAAGRRRLGVLAVVLPVAYSS